MIVKHIDDCQTQMLQSFLALLGLQTRRKAMVLTFKYCHDLTGADKLTSIGVCLLEHISPVWHGQSWSFDRCL